MSLCTDCKLFFFNAFEQGYSELTPGEPLKFGCTKRIWDYTDLVSSGDLARRLDTANTCPSFEEK